MVIDPEEALKKQIYDKQCAHGRCCGVRADQLQAEIDVLRQRLAAIQAGKASG